MLLALECPTEHLDMIQPFADFEWVLANKYLSEPRYATFYKQSRRVKFLDNGVTETGEPVSYDDIIKIANEINATFVVARDWIGDFQKTVAAYQECREKFGAKTVGVLQGSTPEEAIQCVNYYDCKLLLVPYHVGGSDRKRNPQLMALKRALVVSNLPPNRFVHLLGFTTTDELKWYRGKTNVVSLDTDIPVKAGLAGQDLDEFDRIAEVPTKVTKDNWAAVCRNLSLLRKAMVLDGGIGEER